MMMNPSALPTVSAPAAFAPSGSASPPGAPPWERRPDPFDSPDALRGGTLPPRPPTPDAQPDPQRERPPVASASRFRSADAAALFPMPPPGVLVVLHLSCGPAETASLHPEFQGPGWRAVRVDEDEAAAPDLVAPLTDLGAIPSGSAHAVYCSHGLERLAAHEVPRALGELARVLRPTGIALLAAIDLQRVAELVVADRLLEPAYQSPAGPISARDLLFGHGASLAAGRDRLAHRTGFTARALGELLLGAGFAHVDINRQGLDLWALAQVTPPAEPGA